MQPHLHAPMCALVPHGSLVPAAWQAKVDCVNADRSIRTPYITNNKQKRVCMAYFLFSNPYSRRSYLLFHTDVPIKLIITRITLRNGKIGRGCISLYVGFKSTTFARSEIHACSKIERCVARLSLIFPNQICTSCRTL